MNINKKVIAVILIILIIALGVLLVMLKKSKNNNETVPEYTDQNYHVEVDAEKVTDISEYYTVQNIIKQFNKNIADLNANAIDLNLIIDDDEDEEEVLQEYKEDTYKYFMDVLANDYKTSYSVNNTYIDKLLKPYSKKSYTIDSMFVIHDIDSKTGFYNWIDTYFVFGKYEQNEFNFVIVLDKRSNSYEMYLNNFFVQKGYKKDDTNTMKSLKKESVESKENNRYNSVTIDRQQLAELYYNDFVALMKNNPQEAYNKLDKEYKNKRYNTFEKFQDYIRNAITSNKNLKLDQYNIQKYDGYTEVTCQDNMGRRTIFKSEGGIDYTVMLDSYTLYVKSYEEEYNKADEAKKAQLCLNRFIECINLNDYETAYSFLNESYKQNNFPTVEDFTKYVKNNWFEVNTFEYREVTKTQSTYTLKGKMVNAKIAGSIDSGTKSVTFIVRPGATISNFELSFELS